MISIEDAQRLILEQTPRLTAEVVPLLQGLGRVIAVDLPAPRDLPEKDNSAMDGYAFAFSSLQGDTLKANGFISAGCFGGRPVHPGEAVRIMTGASIPEGCDTVVPLEDLELCGDTIRITGAVQRGSHIRRRGGELRAGDLAIQTATLLRPQEIGRLASFGHDSVTIYRRPVVGIIATGDELAAPGVPLMPGRIYDSNSYALAAQVSQAGGEALLFGQVPDSLEAVRSRIVKAISAGIDCLIISGGVSVGDRDYVRQAIQASGGEILFWRVNIKPGKPLAFALLEGKPVFALPGNPLSAMVSFELFIRPALLKMAGQQQIYRPLVLGTLEFTAQNESDRITMIAVRVGLADGEYRIFPTGKQCSGRLAPLTAGNGLLRLETGQACPAGSQAMVMLLSDATMVVS